jgi:hypothetical protein
MHDAVEVVSLPVTFWVQTKKTSVQVQVLSSMIPQKRFLFQPPVRYDRRGGHPVAKGK